VEEMPVLIVKKDGRREPFDPQKLLRGMMAACQKRPVTLTQLEEAVGDIQARLLDQPDREISSRSLGDLVMDALKRLDSVAYVRFASVYRDFKDLPDFVKALEGMMVGPGVAPTAPVIPPRPHEAPATGSLMIPSPTPLFPGLAPARLGPSKRRKGR
jgi:transcriptional repressor NrdR